MHLDTSWPAQVVASPAVPKERLIRGSEALIAKGLPWSFSPPESQLWNRQPDVMITSWDSFWDRHYLKEPQIFVRCTSSRMACYRTRRPCALTPDRFTLRVQVSCSSWEFCGTTEVPRLTVYWLPMDKATGPDGSTVLERAVLDPQRGQGWGTAPCKTAFYWKGESTALGKS